MPPPSAEPRRGSLKITSYGFENVWHLKTPPKKHPSHQSKISYTKIPTKPPTPKSKKGTYIVIVNQRMLKVVVIPSQNEGFYNTTYWLTRCNAVVIPSQNENFYNRRRFSTRFSAVVIPSQNEGFYNDNENNKQECCVVIPSQNEGFYNWILFHHRAERVVIPSQNEGFYNTPWNIDDVLYVVIPSQNEGFYNAATITTSNSDKWSFFLITFRIKGETFPQIYTNFTPIHDFRQENHDKITISHLFWISLQY